MAKKGRYSKAKLSANAVAKIEASAKASFQRKKTITEVVPADVTRAKAGAWLDLLSPITEWAGLKGDALRHKRDLLRVQQEETLLRIAWAVHDKISGNPNIRRIRSKILVPALEQASLEDASDDVMVDRWASLLASAAEQVGVQPRFVGILGELAGAQAECLERLAFNNYQDVIFPDSDFEDSFITFADHSVSSFLRRGANLAFANGEDIGTIIDKIVEDFARPGVFLVTIFVTRGKEAWEHDSGAGVRDDANWSILESLGLIRYAVVEFNADVIERRSGPSFEFSLYYRHLTLLGIEFCRVCSRSRVENIKKIGDDSRRKNLRREHSFII